jgi:hypothetical protein
MARWWRPHVGGYSFQETSGAKQTTGGLSRSTVPPPVAFKPPPVPDTAQMQTQRAAYDVHYQNAVSQSNWDGGRFERRHEAVGTNFALMGEGEPRYGGTVHHQQNSTAGPERYPDPWHSSGVPAGPPLPHPAERLGPRVLGERLREGMDDPYGVQPREIIDMRDSGGPLSWPSDPGGRPVVEWPGDGRNTGPTGWFW